MLIFPLIYLISFVMAVREVYKGKAEGILLFFFFGLFM